MLKPLAALPLLLLLTVALSLGCGAGPDETPPADDGSPPLPANHDGEGPPDDDDDDDDDVPAPPVDEPPVEDEPEDPPVEEPPVESEPEDPPVEEPPVEEPPAEPVPANAAAIVSHSLPETLQCGEAVTASVTVQNVGSSPWTRESGHKLGGVGDSDPLVNDARVWLPEDAVVEPGDTWTFVIEGHAPSEPGTYLTEWRMVHELVEWFGEVASTELVVPACPAPPVPSECAPGPSLDEDREPCAEAVAATSASWPVCQEGDELACHLLVREIASALAAGDPNWGLITKAPGQNQCTETQCGPLGGDGYGVDIVAYHTDAHPGTDWQGFDIVVAIGSPDARLSWQVLDPSTNRDSNHWAPVP